MSERAPYSRVYWEIIDDPKFVTIFNDNNHLATWLRLLIVADQAHPASAPIPTGTRRASLMALVDAELVDLGTAHRYRIRGLDAERERRKTLATSRGPSGDRAGTTRAVNGFGTQGPSKAEQSKEELSQAEPIARDPADIYWQLTGKYPADRQPGQGTLTWLDQLTSEYGAESVITALAQAHRADRDLRTLLSRSQDLLRSDARKVSLKERNAEQERIREIRAQPRVLEPWREEYRRAIEEQYGRAS